MFAIKCFKEMIISAISKTQNKGFMFKKALESLGQTKYKYE